MISSFLKLQNYFSSKILKILIYKGFKLHKNGYLVGKISRLLNFAPVGRLRKISPLAFRCSLGFKIPTIFRRDSKTKISITAGVAVVAAEDTFHLERLRAVDPLGRTLTRRGQTFVAGVVREECAVASLQGKKII